MTTEDTSPWLAHNPAAQAFLADLMARREHALEGIGNALDRLGELAEVPAEEWRPAAADRTVWLEEVRALMDRYRRGMMAAGLVADAAAGGRIFYRAGSREEGTPEAEFLRREDVTAGVLARAAMAMLAARRVFSYAYAASPPFSEGSLLGLHPRHEEVLWLLEQTIGRLMSERLRSES